MLPSAPEYVEQLYFMYEVTQINAEDFRLKKSSDLQTELTNEADHYRQVAKNTKEHTPLHTSQLSALVHFLLDCHQQPWQQPALTGFEIVASPALASVATVLGLFSVGFATVNKRLESKVTKHEKIYTLVLAKQNSVSELVSKALTDKRISDSEFTIILRKVEKYL